MLDIYALWAAMNVNLFSTYFIYIKGWLVCCLPCLSWQQQFAEHTLCVQYYVKYNKVREEMKMLFSKSLHHGVTMLQNENMANNINSKNAKWCTLGELQEY
jgi:hypothetical protein